MVRFTAAQISSVRGRTGLFSMDVWVRCGFYVFTLALHPDPEHNPEWIYAGSVVQRFLDWTLEQADARFGPAGWACLDFASRCDMSEELYHPLHVKPCVFSGRRRVQTCRQINENEPLRLVSTRVQRRFTWWAAHPQTGLFVPFKSRWFVYESIYTPLLQAIHILGRFNQHLIQLGQEISLRNNGSGFSVRQLSLHSEWKNTYKKINDILFVICIMVNDTI